MSSNFKPRLPTSQTWTELPTDFTGKVQSVFAQEFPVELRSGEFLVEGRIYAAEMVIRLGFLEKGRLKQINFEASVDLPPEPSSAANLNGTLPNAAAAIASEFAAEDESNTDLEDDSELDLDGDDPESDGDGETDSEYDREISKTMDLLYGCIDALGSVMEEYFDLDEKEEIDVPESWQAFDFEGVTIYLQQSSVNTQLEAEADRILGFTESQLVHDSQKSEDALSKAEISNVLAFNTKGSRQS